MKGAKLIRLLLGVALALAMGGARSADAQNTLSDIKSRGKAVVATEAAYAPFEFLQDGKIVGYDKDVLDGVIKGWNVQLEQLDVPFAGILAGLIEKKDDFVSTALLRRRSFAWWYVPLEVIRSYVAIFCWLRAWASRRIAWRGHPFVLQRGSAIVSLSTEETERSSDRAGFAA